MNEFNALASFDAGLARPDLGLGQRQIGARLACARGTTCLSILALMSSTPSPTTSVPTSVSVVAALLILSGLSTLLGAVSSLLQLLALFVLASSAPDGLLAVVAALTLVCTLLGAGAIAAGVGLLKLREWGRRGSVWCCYAFLALVVVMGLKGMSSTSSPEHFMMFFVVTLLLAIPPVLMLRPLRGRAVHEAIWLAEERRRVAAGVAT